MAYSTPSPSDTGSNWSSSGSWSSSSSFSDFGTSSTGGSMAYTTMSEGRIDYSPVPTTPLEGLPRKHHKSRSETPMSASCPTGTTTTRAAVHKSSPKSVNRRYAGEDDWRRHRDRISSLYKTKRLKDVMAIMQSEHGLHATERMYKARFKDWGLQKNVTAAEVHKLMQKVEQEQQRRHQRSPSGDNDRVVLDIGDDLDVRRIQKYMKRRPKGLDNLRKDPHRPLEVIKALSVDGEKGRGKVSIATVKLEDQGQDNDCTLTSPSLDLALPWSPVPEVPGEIAQLLQIFIDNGFDAAYAYNSSSSPSFTPSLSPQWQQHGHGHSNSLDSIASSFEAVSSRDELMLDFVLKLRVANILLEEGFVQQGYHGINNCLDSLAVCLQQSQNIPGLSTRSATVVVLWALLAALEMMVDFKQMENSVLHMVYQRLMTHCASYQPTMAETVRKLSQLGSREQVASIKLARKMISRALFTDPSCYEPSFETYLRTVDVAVSPVSAADKVQAMQALTNKPILPGASNLDAWAEMRTALAMCKISPSLQQDCYPFSPPLGLCDPAMTSSWNGYGNKIASALDYISGRIECHKTAGSWQTAQELASQAASVAEMAWGYDGEMTRSFRCEVETLRSPGQVPCSMVSPLEPSLVQMDLPLAGLSFSSNHAGVLEKLSWPQVPDESHGLYPCGPISQWAAQVDGSLGSPCILTYDSVY